MITNTTWHCKLERTSSHWPRRLKCLSQCVNEATLQAVLEGYLNLSALKLELTWRGEVTKVRKDQTSLGWVGTSDLRSQGGQTINTWPQVETSTKGRIAMRQGSRPCWGHVTWWIPKNLTLCLLNDSTHLFRLPFSSKILSQLSCSFCSCIRVNLKQLCRLLIKCNIHGWLLQHISQLQ